MTSAATAASSEESDVDEVEWELCAHVARLFYLEDRSKSDIAAMLGMSRFKVARLLERGREEHVVSITINPHPAALTADASRLAERLGLESAVVVPTEQEEAANRAALARAAAELLRARTQPGAVVGFSWGRTIVELSRQVGWLPPCTVLPLTGTVGNDIEQSPIDVIRRIAATSDVEGKAIYAPMFSSSAAGAAELRADPAIADVLALHGRMTVAVVAVGAWDRPSPISQTVALLSAQEVAGLRRDGVVAELVGTFLRADGTVIETESTARGLFVSLDALRATPCVLAVAGGLEKASAIVATARSGLITALVTDERTARHILDDERVWRAGA